MGPAPLSAATPTSTHERTRGISRRRSECVRSWHFLLLALFGLAACDGASPTGPGEEVPDLAAGSTDRSGAAATPAASEGSAGARSELAVGDSATARADSAHAEEQDSSSSHPDAREEVVYGNEPAGFTRISETSYASGDEDGWASSDEVQFIEDPSAPRSPGTVAQAVFPSGWDGGSAPVWSESNFSEEGVTKIYVSYWIKISDNWQGHSSGVNKTAIIWTHGKPVAVANIGGSGSGPLGSEIRIQDVPGEARNLSPNLQDSPISRGRWHHWEIVLVNNTGGSGDGEVHWWVDGEKVGEYRDVRFSSSDQPKTWDRAAWRPVWGGNGDTVRSTMRMWMDHYYVAGAR